MPATLAGKQETAALQLIIKERELELAEKDAKISKLEYELSTQFIASEETVHNVKTHVESKLEEATKEAAEKVEEAKKAADVAAKAAADSVLEAKKAAEEAHKKAEHEIEAAKKEAEVKVREATELAEKSGRGLGLLPGELEFMQKAHKKTLGAGELFRVTLSRARRQSSKDVGPLHYAAVEAAFLRLTSFADYQVVSVEYVVNPVLTQKFEAKRNALAKNGSPAGHVLAFHGTAFTNIDKILTGNFKMPGNGHGSAHGLQYGAGIYFSEKATKAISYTRDTLTDGAQKLIVSKVLLGKVFVTPPCPSARLKAGYDSHQSSNGIELVVFDPDMVNPSYVMTVAKKPNTVEIGT